MLLLAGWSGIDRSQTERPGRNVAATERVSKVPEQAPERSPEPSPQRSPEPSPSRDVDCERDKCVALTFDDGPGPHTPRLLDALDRAEARATFFVQGEYVSDHPGVTRRMAAEGHEIGNHTWDHAELTTLSRGEIRKQIRRTQRAVRDAAGVEPTMMRPPYRALDASVVDAVGMPVVLWSVDSRDWSHDDVARKVKEGVRDAERGDILLYHDVHGSTVKAMPEIVDGLQRRGFTLVTVSELLEDERLEAGETYSEAGSS
ncbi:polysaccharide deacetylase family protein [Actinomadura sp. WMMB 499]|nr:polysaccharide deacetylase family protein [Actinomadura sp. WMMB 499]